MHTVFPDIFDITVPPMADNANIAKIYVWPVLPNSERDDLAIPLQDSGTGIGQVLAILYVALTSAFPRSIIVDEPQSFLHPAAIRKLFEILQISFPQHQYIATTHSPLVVSASNPGSITLLQKVKFETQVQQVSSDEAHDLRITLDAVGARFSDVFGAERILWVEGRTEESSFPIIIRALLRQALFGTAVLGILNVGDLEGRHAETIIRIYRRLSEGGALLPPAIGFLLDVEGRSEKEQEDLRRESGGKVHFLPRRMYENYLVDAEAIASIIASLQDFADTPVGREQITAWIDANRWDSNYFDDLTTLPDRGDATWLRYVHGARFIGDLFSALSERRYEYEKVTYGPALTEWLVQHRPEALVELAKLLGQILAQPEGAS